MQIRKKLFSSVFLALALLSTFSFAGFTQPVAASGMFNQYITNESEYFFTRGSVTVNNISVSDLFEFTSDGRNDIYWYPGVTASVRTSGNGGAGTTYTQSIDFGGFALTSYLEILAKVPNKAIVQKATGAFENYAMYVYTRGANGSARLTIYSAVKKAPGVTAEGLEYILNATFPILLNYLGKTGTFTVNVI